MQFVINIFETIGVKTSNIFHVHVHRFNNTRKAVGKVCMWCIIKTDTWIMKKSMMERYRFISTF